MKRTTPKAGKITPTEFSKRIATRMRARIIEDNGCRAVSDVVRDANGDTVGHTNWRAVLSARMVNEDFEMILNLDGLEKRSWLDGLNISSFEGLGIGPDNGHSDVYACFSNGRAVPFVREEVKPITDPAELTARESQLARIQKTRDAERTAEREQEEEGRRGPQSAFSQAAHLYVKEEWPRYVEMRKASGSRATRNGFVKHSNFKDDCKKHGITCGADIEKIQDCERKKSAEV